MHNTVQIRSLLYRCKDDALWKIKKEKKTWFMMHWVGQQNTGGTHLNATKCLKVAPGREAHSHSDSCIRFVRATIMWWGRGAPLLRNFVSALTQTHMQTTVKHPHSIEMWKTFAASLLSATVGCWLPYVRSTGRAISFTRTVNWSKR